jgi:hypothetical protein
MSAGTDNSTVRSVSRAMSTFGLPSIWPHIEPEASSTTMARSAACASAVVQKTINAASALRERNAMSVSR